MSEPKYEDEMFQVQLYRNLRVGWIKKGELVGFILNPFNFTFYGTVEGNIIAQKIINVLSVEFKDKPINVQTLTEADEWVQKYANQFSV